MHIYFYYVRIYVHRRLQLHYDITLTSSLINDGYDSDDDEEDIFISEKICN